MSKISKAIKQDLLTLLRQFSQMSTAFNSHFYLHLIEATLSALIAFHGAPVFSTQCYHNTRTKLYKKTWEKFFFFSNSRNKRKLQSPDSLYIQNQMQYFPKCNVMTTADTKSFIFFSPRNIKVWSTKQKNCRQLPPSTKNLGSRCYTTDNKSSTMHILP